MRRPNGHVRYLLLSGQKTLTFTSTMQGLGDGNGVVTFLVDDDASRAALPPVLQYTTSSISSTTCWSSTPRSSVSAFKHSLRELLIDDVVWCWSSVGII